MSSLPPPDSLLPPKPGTAPEPLSEEAIANVPEGYEIVDESPKRASVWTTPQVATGLGIGASIVVHIAIIVLGLLLIPQFREVVSGKKVAEQTIVPIAELATEQAGGIPNPGMTDDRNRPAGQTLDSTVTQTDAWSERRSSTLDRNLSSGSGDAAPTQIGIGGNKSAGSGLGSGVAGGGGLAKFGVPGGGSGIGPRGAVFGNGGNAYRIVFVCDGTGDMVSSVAYPVLLRELAGTMAKLKPKQSFNVVFFYDGTKYASVDPGKLIPAVPVNSEKLQTFLKNFSGGAGTDPRPAITFAFSLKPDLIYFLSNGNFADLATYSDVTDTFKKLNPSKTVRVNTILLKSITPEDMQKKSVQEAMKDAADTMTVIAKANGGTFNSIDARSVYLPGQ
ncbi:MAG: hypothetical protein JWM57_3366 [Phycisphaerales bacterium]|nr:hypothetical protein [Phycisphaerales bacterium]